MSENTEIAVAPGSEHRDQRTLSSFASSSHFCHFSFPFIHPPTSPLSLDGNVLSLHWEREQLCQRVQFIYRHLHPGSCTCSFFVWHSLLRLCSCVHPGVSSLLLFAFFPPFFVSHILHPLFASSNAIVVACANSLSYQDESTSESAMGADISAERGASAPLPPPTTSSMTLAMALTNTATALAATA